MLSSATLRIGLTPMVLLGMFSAASVAATLAPDDACHFLADERLDTRGGYRPLGESAYQCASPERALTAGGHPPHDIRYVVQGTQDQATELSLTLRVQTREDIQRAHRILEEHAAALTAKVTGSDLPPEAGDAILSAIEGEWTIGNTRVTLRRNTAGTARYELIFTLFPGDSPD
ncbi:MAG: hypothetical protein ABFS23_13380 [Pseudomonadota bacterium]